MYNYFRNTNYGGGYYRVGFRRPPNVILTLILVNAFVFLLEHINPDYIVLLFGLVPPLITKKLFLWQFVTYMFLHGNFWHLFFNMFALYIFGHDLLMLWGHRRFLTYYFVSGIGAGLCAYIFTNVPTIGASGAIYGLLLAYGLTFPNRVLLLYFFIPMRAKYLVVLFGAVEFLASITSRADGIAHTAHLGGMLFGAMMIIIHKIARRYRFRPPRGTPFDEFTILRPQEPEEIDEILDKILKYGIESLTPDERAILLKTGKFFARHYNIDRTKDERRDNKYRK